MAVIALTTGAVRAADIAFDSAGDSAYNNGWSNGSNGGYGWGGPWSISTLPGGATLGDSTTNGPGDPEGDGDINSPRVAGGRAWDLSGGTAIRMFSSPLSVGQTFSIDYDVDESIVSVNWVRYLDLLAPSGEIDLAIRYYAGDLLEGFTFPAVETGIPDDAAGLHLEFTELSSGVNVAITPLSPGAPTSTFSLDYTGEIVGVRLVSAGTNSLIPSSGTSFFNNIAITPEPSCIAVLGLAVCGLLVRRR